MSRAIMPRSAEQKPTTNIQNISRKVITGIATILPILAAEQGLTAENQQSERPPFTEKIGGNINVGSRGIIYSFFQKIRADLKDHPDILALFEEARQNPAIMNNILAELQTQGWVERTKNHRWHSKIVPLETTVNLDQAALSRLVQTALMAKLQEPSIPSVLDLRIGLGESLKRDLSLRFNQEQKNILDTFFEDPVKVAGLINDVRNYNKVDSENRPFDLHPDAFEEFTHNLARSEKIIFGEPDEKPKPQIGLPEKKSPLIFMQEIIPDDLATQNGNKFSAADWKEMTDFINRDIQYSNGIRSKKYVLFEAPPPPIKNKVVREVLIDILSADFNESQQIRLENLLANEEFIFDLRKELFEKSPVISLNTLKFVINQKLNHSHEYLHPEAINFNKNLYKAGKNYAKIYSDQISDEDIAKNFLYEHAHNQLIAFSDLNTKKYHLFSPDALAERRKILHYLLLPLVQGKEERLSQFEQNHLNLLDTLLFATIEEHADFSRNYIRLGRLADWINTEDNFYQAGISGEAQHQKIDEANFSHILINISENKKPQTKKFSKDSFKKYQQLSENEILAPSEEMFGNAKTREGKGDSQETPNDQNEYLAVLGILPFVRRRRQNIPDAIGEAIINGAETIIIPPKIIIPGQKGPDMAILPDEIIKAALAALFPQRLEELEELYRNNQTQAEIGWIGEQGFLEIKELKKKFEELLNGLPKLREERKKKEEQLKETMALPLPKRNEIVKERGSFWSRIKKVIGKEKNVAESKEKPEIFELTPKFELKDQPPTTTDELSIKIPNNIDIANFIRSLYHFEKISYGDLENLRGDFTKYMAKKREMAEIAEEKRSLEKYIQKVAADGGKIDFNSMWEGRRAAKPLPFYLKQMLADALSQKNAAPERKVAMAA